MHKIVIGACLEMQDETSRFCLGGQGWLHQDGAVDLMWVEKVHRGRGNGVSTGVQMGKSQQSWEILCRK